MEVTQATLSALRRELHRYPELALEEHHTAQVIERELDKIPKEKARDIAQQSIQAIRASDRRDFRF